MVLTRDWWRRKKTLPPACSGVATIVFGFTAEFVPEKTNDFKC